MFHSTWPPSDSILYNKNSTANETRDDDFLTNAEMTGILFCHILLGTIGLLVNIGVILVITFNRIMLDIPANWLVVSLAVADAVACVAISIIVNIYIFTELNLETLALIFRFVAFSSTGNLFILTFNRFLSVHNSLRYPAIMTTSRAKCLAIIPWTIAFLFSLGYKWTELSEISYIILIYYGGLIISITGLNVYILKEARGRSNEIKRLERQVLGRKTTSSTKEFRLAIRLLIVSLTFFASSIPLLGFAQEFKKEESRRSVSVKRKFVWTIVAMQVNAIIDPFVYSFDHPIFKRYFEKIRNRIYRRNMIVPSATFNKDSGAVKIYDDQEN